MSVHCRSEPNAAHDKSTFNINIARRPRQSPYPMLNVEDAMNIIFKNINNIEVQTVVLPVAQAVGHVLAENVCSRESVPNFAASIKDGYAVIAADGEGQRTVVSLDVNANDALQPGCCARIHTGGPIPKGADAVVEVEQTELLEAEDDEERIVLIKRAPKVGQDIRGIGSDTHLGDVILNKGVRISSAELGVLYSVGVAQVNVVRKLNVGIASTGDELCEPDTAPLPFGRVRDTNRPMLIQLMKEYLFTPTDLGIIRDNPDDLLNAFKMAFQTVDVVISSGGMSMSERDMVKEVLAKDLGFELHFGRVFMKPGKPTAFMTGRLNGSKKFFFGLPGNPVSAWVTAHIFVIPALLRAEGQYTEPFPHFPVEVSDYYNLDPRPEYVRALYRQESISHLWKANIFEPNQSSSRLVSIKNANVLLMLPPRSEKKNSITPGDVVQAILIRSNL